MAQIQLVYKRCILTIKMFAIKNGLIQISFKVRLYLS
jgi:hypothetical protein